MQIPSASKDQLFLVFCGALFTVLALFGVAVFVVVVWGDRALGGKMVNVFASMFTGILGLGSGYLLGRNGNSKKEGT
jgi:hypothetical protein